MTATKIEPGMGDDEYTHTQNVVTAITNTVCNLDLDGFIDRLVETELMGEREDPAMWAMAEGRLRQVKECAVKLRELRDLVNEHAETEVEEAKKLEERIKGIEAKHEEQSQTTAQPYISGDPSIIIGGIDTDEDDGNEGEER